MYTAAKATVSGKYSEPLLSPSDKDPERPSCSHKQDEIKTKEGMAKETENLKHNEVQATVQPQNEGQLNGQPNADRFAEDLEAFDKCKCFLLNKLN